MNSKVTVHGLNRFANFFLVVENQGLTLIDAGSKDSVERIEKKFESLGHELKGLQRIVITHAHYDHTGSAALLKEATGAKVLAHEAEVPYLDHRERVPRPRGLGGFLFYLTEPLFRAPPVEVDLALADGDGIEGTGLRVIHVPGHTPGSICLYHEQARALFTGDCINNLRGRLRGPVPYFSSDIDRAKKSVARLLELDLKTVYFAHGEVRRKVKSEEFRRELERLR